jgi:uracil-DNA glycosylase
MGMLKALIKQARACRVCAPHLPLGPRPVFLVGAGARLLVVGQAPGRRVHETGIPWNDPSGEQLRAWLQMDRVRFYDSTRVAILPTGLCYPGSGARGDLPPRPECAPLWHARLLAELPRVRLTLLLSRYAQAHYLPEAGGRTLTETVRAWREHGERVLPLPHPSPRNQRWFAANPWFADELLPVLRARVQHALAG